MKALEASETRLVFIRLCADDDNNASKIKIEDILRPCLIISLFVVADILPSIRYLCHNLNDILGCTFAMMAFMGILSTIVSLTTITLQKGKVRRIIEAIRQLTDKEQDEKIVQLYKYNERINKFITKKLIITVLVGFTLHAIVFGIGSIFYYNYYQHIFNPQNWYLPCRLERFIDESTIVGYICAMISDVSFVLIFYVISLNIFAFFVGSCSYIRSFCVLLKYLYGKMDETAVSKHRSDMKSLFRRSIEIQKVVNSIYGELGSVMSATIFLHQMFAIIFMATATYHFDSALRNFDLNACIIISSTFLHLLENFLYCFVGEQVTLQLKGISDTVCQTKWYLYPADLSKYLPFVILNNQNIAYFSGVGMLNLSLSTFLKVSNTALSYYLMFKKVSTRQLGV